MNKYGTEEERAAAIAAGETSARTSTLQDGNKHYAVVAYSDEGDRRVRLNLTGTEQDSLDDAERLARNWDHGPFAQGMAGYGAERIA